MDDRPSSVTRALTTALMGLAALQTGCQFFQKRQAASSTAAKPAAAAQADEKPAKPGIPVAALLPQWSRKVEMGTNPVDNKPMPAIVGRIYFFDAKYNPVEADGTLTVELYDDTNRSADKPCEKLGTWNIDPKQLAKWKSSDPVVGTGYTLALPWPSYKPDIAQIQITVRYTPRSGQPLSLQDQAMTLEQNRELIAAYRPSAPVQTAAATSR